MKNKVQNSLLLFLLLFHSCNTRLFLPKHEIVQKSNAIFFCYHDEYYMLLLKEFKSNSFRSFLMGDLKSNSTLFYLGDETHNNIIYELRNSIFSNQKVVFFSLVQDQKSVTDSIEYSEKFIQFLYSEDYHNSMKKHFSKKIETVDFNNIEFDYKVDFFTFCQSTKSVPSFY